MEVTAKTKPTNGAASLIEIDQPFRVAFRIRGTADIMFHRWNVESVEEKAAAKKGSKQKKTDDTESYLYRDENNLICLPIEYLRMAVITAAKFQQDPRSPRKSAMDLYKASVIGLTTLMPICTHQMPNGMTVPDYYDKRRVVIMRAGINRIRPCIRQGWHADGEFLINTPEYIDIASFHETLSRSGILVGVGDFRPTYGRFQVERLELLELT